MTTPSSQSELDRSNEKRRRSWAKQAPKYDRSMGFFERRVFGTDHRSWACSRATGDTLEVAIGTGLNIPIYEQAVRLTGIDLSPEMLEIARERAAEVRRSVELREGDAHALSFPDASFDTVVCTYSLCNISDPQCAVSEMKRVLRSGGRLILVDHIRSHSSPLYWFQKVLEFFTRRLEGENMTRRPADDVEIQGFDIVERERLGPGGIVERLVAQKP
ncbi:MAG: class I SAM-dependent methyltransferase [Actinomycetota bacterium]